MHLAGEVGEAHPAVRAGGPGSHGGQRHFQRGVAVVVALEVEERGQQRAPLALGRAHREQEEDGVVLGLLGHDRRVLVQVGGHELCRDAPALELSVDAHARREQGHLDGVEHGVAVGQALEPVPGISGMQEPRLRACGQELVGGVGERHSRPRLGVDDLVGLPAAEEPVVAEFALGPCHGLTEGHGFLDGLGREHEPALAFHHLRGHVVGGDDRVKR